MACSAFAIPYICNLLDRAIEKGDCMAPYFLHYMQGKGYDVGEPLLLPDLTLVPSHRAQGEKWVAGYVLYLETFKLIKDRSQNTEIIIASSIRERKLKQDVSQKKHTNRNAQITKNIEKLSNTDCPVDSLFAAKLMERLGVGLLLLQVRA